MKTDEKQFHFFRACQLLLVSNMATIENIYSTTHYVETPPEDQNLQKTWQYGKTIKCLSVIDSFFIVMNSLKLIVCLTV